jgi:hypothetical protein
MAVARKSSNAGRQSSKEVVKKTVSKSQPKKTKPVGVTKEKGVKVKTEHDQPNKLTRPSGKKVSETSKLNPTKDTIDTAADDMPMAENRDNLPRGARKAPNAYKKTKRTPQK